MVDFKQRLKPPTEEKMEISLPENMLERLEAPPESVSAPPSDHETTARLTIIRMLQEAPRMDQQFSFKTQKNGGQAHVQAMRVALSRVRKTAQKAKRSLKEFRLLVVSIETHPTHDLVTVLRTTKASLKEHSIYEGIMAQLKEDMAPEGEKEGDTE